MFGAPWTNPRAQPRDDRERATRPSRLDNAGLLRWVRGPNVVDVLLDGQSAGGRSARSQHLVGADNAHRLDAACSRRTCRTRQVRRP